MPKNAYCWEKDVKIIAAFRSGTTTDLNWTISFFILQEKAQKPDSCTNNAPTGKEKLKHC